MNSRRVLIPRNVDIIVHIPWDELIFVRHYIRYSTKILTILTVWTKIVLTAMGVDNMLKMWKNGFVIALSITGLIILLISQHVNNGHFGKRQKCNFWLLCKSAILEIFSLFVRVHSVAYDPISAHFFPCGYDQNLSMEYESIQFIYKFAIFRFGSYPQGYWHQVIKIRAIFQF